ncbi:MAG: AraC family transcriptional regulator [Eubacteriales bacterium]|nr:AraC family transcriptional regulator [Eubacteriales bacterium]
MRNTGSEDNTPIYSHNPYDSTKFPLLVLDVHRTVCKPFNEGFRVLHWHEEFQFIYIISGRVHFKIWEEEMDFGAGCCLFINSNVMHHITQKEDCRYHSFLIPPKMLCFFEGSLMEEREVQSVVRNPLFAYFVMETDRADHRELLKKIEELDKLYFLENRPAHWEYRLSVCLGELWLDFIEVTESIETYQKAGTKIQGNSLEKGRKPDAGIPGRSHQRIQALISYIHTNYSRPISLQDIADAASVSQTECLRCFRKYTGYSPYQYLLRYRLQVSTRLLKDRESSITEIALQIGFQSVSSYISYYKKYYGKTPAQYRKGHYDD